MRPERLRSIIKTALDEGAELWVPFTPHLSAVLGQRTRPIKVKIVPDET